MYCLQCGKELPEGARFCLECGAPQNRPAPEAAEQGGKLQKADEQTAEVFARSKLRGVSNILFVVFLILFTGAALFQAFAVAEIPPYEYGSIGENFLYAEADQILLIGLACAFFGALTALTGAAFALGYAIKKRNYAFFVLRGAIPAFLALGQFIVMCAILLIY